MKSSFPKCDKHHSRKWACNANTMLIDYVLEKSLSYIYIYIYTHTKLILTNSAFEAR